MSLSRQSQILCALGAMLAVATLPTAHAASLKAIHRFTNTGNSTQSQFALGATPAAELVQASDGNFYGTTTYGGSGNCPNSSDSADVIGCGTVFRMTPGGTVSVLYSFPYDSPTQTAASGAFPVAGLIQGQDGYLYGVAGDGGMAGQCNGYLGCGTMFRISVTGSFKLLHQFCVGVTGCPSTEGGHPLAHLVQLPNNFLCGTTSQGGTHNFGTVFCASTAGGVNTRYAFQYGNGVDGYDPITALLIGSDGKTLYGTTEFGGENGGGTIFSINADSMTVLHAFDNYESSVAGTCFFPRAALIFGADGKLYGTTYQGGTGGCLFVLNIDGSGFTVPHIFTSVISSDVAPVSPAAGLVLARNGLMYGTTTEGSIEGSGGGNGGDAYSYDPAKKAYRDLVNFTTTTGAVPLAALIEGQDKYLYGTTSLYGGSNKRGTDEGTVVRVAPALNQ